jgi:hypothetical protein
MRLDLGNPGHPVSVAGRQPVGATIAAVGGTFPDQETRAELEVLPADGQIHRVLAQGSGKQRARVPAEPGLIERQVGRRVVVNIAAGGVGAVGERPDHARSRAGTACIAQVELAGQAGREIALGPTVRMAAKVRGRAAVPGVVLGDVGETGLKGGLERQRAHGRRRHLQGILGRRRVFRRRLPRRVAGSGRLVGTWFVGTAWRAMRDQG